MTGVDPSLAGGAMARSVGGAMALGAAALWAVSTTLYKGAIVRYGPRAMNLFRCTIAFALFWITTLAVHGASFFELFATRAGALLLLSGVVGLAIGDLFLFHAIRVLGAQPAVATNQLSPVWSALIGLACGLETLTLRQYVAIVVVIAGVLLVIFGRVGTEGDGDEGGDAHHARRRRWIGLVSALLSSLCNASAVVITHLVINEVGALQGSTLRMTGSALFLFGGSVVSRSLRADVVPLGTLPQRAKEIVAVVLATFLGIFLQQGALARTDASLALCLLSTTPIFLLPLAIGILRERYRGIAVLGTLLAIAGIPLLVLREEADARSTMPATAIVTTDPHSFARPAAAVVRHLDLDLAVDFERRELRGRASFKVDVASGTKELVLDTRDLAIERVTIAAASAAAADPLALPDVGAWKETKFTLGDATKDFPELGRALTIALAPDTKWVTILYATSPSAAACQWLAPEQTAGGKTPFLFTQSEAILARTWIPCQDTPAVRMTYAARIVVPGARDSASQPFLALMSAENPQSRRADGIYTFAMPQAIPSYLMALAVGDIDFRSLGSRCGVYAEPAVVAKAAYEMADLEKMVAAAEQLYGPYRWGRYDVIVLPPSFPFGGMENPRLTFATPTILAGDRSLVSLVAHELAHSWSGNLVTNATWNDFWLNEGFTVYFEHRIMEAVFGKEFDDALAALGLQDLQRSIGELTESKQEKDTCLKLDLAGRNPDDGMTEIAYEKGARFLQSIERAVGRARFDAFLRQWFDANAFQSRTTEQFLAFLHHELVGKDAALERSLAIDAWVYEPGLPANCPRVDSAALARTDAELARFSAGAKASELATKEFTTQQWQQFLRKLPDGVTREQLADLDRAGGLSTRGNSEVLFAWLVQVVAHRYEPAFPALERFLTAQGRRKFLKPLYQALAKSDWGAPLARAIYAKARPTYHAVSRDTIDDILKWEK